MMRLAFHRAFHGYTGGHGKVFDYYRHALAHPGVEPDVFFSHGRDHPDNPWMRAGLVSRDAWQPETADGLFLGGMDWQWWPTDAPGIPVINLVQHVRHADPAADVHPFLTRRAVRVCVSHPVADAINSTYRVAGPVIVIEAALDLPEASAQPDPSVDVVIAALKQPALGRALATRWREAGWSVRLLDGPLPRADYLAAVACGRIVVCLPNATEGFYLPALEAMALGRAVVVPDCIGNRAYTESGVNCVVPAFHEDALYAAVEALRDEAMQSRLGEAARLTAARFTQQAERQAFHRLLDDLPALWREAR